MFNPKIPGGAPPAMVLRQRVPQGEHAAHVAHRTDPAAHPHLAEERLSQGASRRALRKAEKASQGLWKA